MKAPLHMEGHTLPVILPERFEQFYRVSLRTVRGSRIRSRDLMTAYVVWADQAGADSLTFAAIRRLMDVAGHSRVQSNGVHYLDVGFASDFPDIADTLPNPFRGSMSVTVASAVPTPSDLVSKVDAALSALLDLRRAIVAETDRSDPAAAASRILGLFDR